MTGSPCPICGWDRRGPGWRTAVERDVAGADVRPSSDRFGRTVAPLLRCGRCGHASVDLSGIDDALAVAYEGASDEGTDGEDLGRAATAGRDLATLERYVEVGRLLDIGCWTGALLEVAAGRGWEVAGLEPSTWATGRARARGLTVDQGGVSDLPSPNGTAPYSAITCCDVVEHVVDPLEALERMHGALRPGGALLLTVPDAGSVVARSLRGRWWSVLPMHLHYFTRRSLDLALGTTGFSSMHVSRHAKAFSVGYYAGRLAAAVPPLHGPAGAVAGSRIGLRTIAPDLHDRMLVVARRR